MPEKFIEGTPSVALMPAKNYVFKINEEHHVIKIPRKGSYHDIDPEFFQKDSGEFNILDDDTNTLYLPSITKVLFAEKKYPDLKFNQFFIPYTLVFGEKEITITGQVVNMMLPVDTDKEED